MADRVWTETEAVACMRHCPSFRTCSAPRCPLDPLWEKRVVYPEDSRCTVGHVGLVDFLAVVSVIDQLKKSIPEAPAPTS